MPCPQAHVPGLSRLRLRWSSRRRGEPMSPRRGGQQRPEVRRCQPGLRTLPRGGHLGRRETAGRLFLQAKARRGAGPSRPPGLGLSGGFSGSSCPAAPCSGLCGLSPRGCGLSPRCRGLSGSRGTGALAGSGELRLGAAGPGGSSAGRGVRAVPGLPAPPSAARLPPGAM